MPKEIRFNALVQKSGKPEPLLLWTKPEDNQALTKAIKEQRVITVFQKPRGTQKDFGLPGFHQEKFATYLVFPKSLPKLGDARIIGIKYDSLKVMKGVPSPKTKAVAPKIVREKPVQAGEHDDRDGVANLKLQPVPAKNFRVTIMRSASAETAIIIEAKNIAEAEIRALEAIKSKNFSSANVSNEVKTITQL